MIISSFPIVNYSILSSHLVDAAADDRIWRDDDNLLNKIVL